MTLDRFKTILVHVHTHICHVTRYECVNLNNPRNRFIVFILEKWIVIIYRLLKHDFELIIRNYNNENIERERDRDYVRSSSVVVRLARNPDRYSS